LASWCVEFGGSGELFGADEGWDGGESRRLGIQIDTLVGRDLGRVVDIEKKIQ
jgi:hypothetical protein